MSNERSRGNERLGLFTGWGLVRPAIKRTSTLRCPLCSAGSHERMPLDRTVQEFQCLWCNRLVRAGPKDHCIYCAYGSRKCPERQRAQ